MMTRHAPSLASALIALLLAALPAQAQMPAHVKARLDTIGNTFTPESIKDTIELYATEAKSSPRDGVKITRDVSFGPSPLQTLDVYQPEGTTGAPVVVFVHGGGYVAGNKDSKPPYEAIYGNVPLYFARHGFLGINANYRLAPAAPWPAGAQDVGGAVAWIRDNAARYGGDPTRIFLLGHSAGATHAASYVFDRALQPAGGSGVAGVILLSGFYRPAADSPAFVKAYFGTDASQYAARAPLSHVRGSKVAVFLVIAEYDPVYIALPSVELMQALCERDGRCPRFAWLANHNHISTAAHLNTADETLGRQLLEFVRTGR